MTEPMTEDSHQSIDLYSRRAGEFFDDYESLDPSDVHAPLLAYLPPPPATIMDIGAGTGRDAAYFAAQGYQVIAVEPATGFRQRGSSVHQHPQITWIDDRLPHLTQVRCQHDPADVLWLSAVWMHLAPADRPTALDNLLSLLRPSGQLMLNLRIGPAPPDRPMFASSSAEILALAQARGLTLRHHSQAVDALQRPGVHWENLVLGK